MKPPIINGFQALNVFDQDDGCVRCPECGDENTHTVAVGSLKALPENGGEGVDAYPGTQVIGTNTKRRAAVAIVMECENGYHRFALVIQQHKGQNFIEVHCPFTQLDGTPMVEACTICPLSDDEVKAKSAHDVRCYGCWCGPCRDRWVKLRRRRFPGYDNWLPTRR